MTLRIFAEPGCPSLTSSSYCLAHEPKDMRPSAAERGYGPRWAAYAEHYKTQHPRCIRCLAAGKQSPSEVVDHIKPVSGPRDAGFWDLDNHQPLCRSCHATKTAEEGRTSAEAAPQRARGVIGS